MDGEGLACVGLFDAGGIPIGRAAPDAVEFVGGGSGGFEFEGFGYVDSEGLGLGGGVAEGEDAFARAPCGPTADLQLVGVAADPVNILES